MPNQDQRPGYVIAKYRVRQGLTEAELGALLGLDHSAISRFETGARAIPAKHAAHIATILKFTPEDRAWFLAAVGIEDQTELDRAVRVAQRLAQIARENFARNPALQRMRGAHALPQWLFGRWQIARFDMQNAVTTFRHVEPELRELLDPHGEWYPIILIDCADAYAIAGLLDNARDEAERAESLCRTTYRQHPSQRNAMSLARAIVMQLEVAYERGDWGGCEAQYARALPLLEAAEDYYGLSKARFFRALFHFWQGDLDAALAEAIDARATAERIQIKVGPFWAIRDGFNLQSHWWHVHTQSLLLDILACRGEWTTDTYGELAGNHRAGHALLSWTRDFPPFTPRYRWLGEPGPTPQPQYETRFRRWDEEVKRLGCQHLHVDILLSHGDYLYWGCGEEEKARRVYLQAAREAKGRYALFAEAAHARLAHAVPFPGLGAYRR